MKLCRHQAAAELHRRHFTYFAQAVTQGLSLTQFHRTYYELLERFARGEIKRLIITIPPQHGKSHGSSILLPAYILGLDPSLRIALASYSLSLASRFNRRVRQIMNSSEYQRIFPRTRLPGQGGKRYPAVCSNTEFDIAGETGGLLCAGREGALTGNPVDIFILDDLYKDAMEANSPVIRGNTWEWYNSVAKTRLHNDSQELIVFTRWHEEDLIGMIEARERVTMLTEMPHPQATDDGSWYRLNFEAIKRGRPCPIDPRADGEPLWGAKHSLRLLERKRLLDPIRFEAMYQGNPSSKESLLYGDNFLTYETPAEDIIKRANYTDTADTGEDFLCSLCYEVGTDGLIYITDAVYTPQSMELTEPMVAQMLMRCGTDSALIESNNGGRGFARALARLSSGVRIEWFHQSRNKEARILSNATDALRLVRFPADWKSRWPRLHADLAGYSRIYRSNRRHDAADVLTGIVETESEPSRKSSIKAVGFKKPQS